MTNDPASERCACLECWGGNFPNKADRTKLLCFEHGCSCCTGEHGRDFAVAIGQALQACRPEARIPFPVLPIMRRQRVTLFA